MTGFSRLKETQLDTLKELGRLGMGHAATALSQLLDEKIEVRVPRASVIDLAGVPDLLGGPERVVVGVTLQILGEARGNILLVFPPESARRLLSRLLKTDDPPLASEIAVSTLKEVGNILASSYLTALGSLTHMTLIPSVPLLAVDMFGAMLDHVLIPSSLAGDLALTVETEFHGERQDENPLGGHLLLFPEPASLKSLLRAFGEEG